MELLPAKSWTTIDLARLAQLCGMLLLEIYLISVYLCLLYSWLDIEDDYGRWELFGAIAPFLNVFLAFCAIFLIPHAIRVRMNRRSIEKNYVEAAARIERLIAVDVPAAEEEYEKLKAPFYDLQQFHKELGDRIKRTKWERYEREQQERRAAEEKEKQEKRKRIAREVETGKILESITPREFEIVVLKAFSRLGYTVQATPYSGDSGVDGFLEKDGEKTAIQCKKHKNPVGSPALRNFYGAMKHFECDQGFFITTSSFSPPAKAFAQGKQIFLYDKPATLALLRDTMKDGFLIEGKRIVFP